MDHTVMIHLSRVADVVERCFTSFSWNPIADVFEQVKKLADGDFIELDVFLIIAMTEWEKEQNCNRELFTSIFQAADINKDGVLSFEEFGNIICQIDPNVSARKQFLMFDRAVNLSTQDPHQGTSSEATPEDAIIPDAFCSVCLAEGLSAEHYTKTRLAALEANL